MCTLPNQIFEANAGFSRELTLNKANRQTHEKEVSWGVDTNVTVNPMHICEVEISVVEEKLACRFTMTTRVHGRLRAYFTDRTKDNAFLKYLEGDIGTIVERALKEYKSANRNEVRGVRTLPHPSGINQRIVIFETRGKSFFRFGVKQVVEVRQTPIPKASYNCRQ
ncbi:unnamed protein product [Protopolystoma xenopodis]|uniref:Uncharacterized protein n=1 Tax=Protopolystoma xenopodis TaxID=117903 RepID=A0A448XC01_9PLAT|nr:unnamed protein product [Protopolystoma xenopodis]